MRTKPIAAFSILVLAAGGLEVALNQTVSGSSSSLHIGSLTTDERVYSGEWWPTQSVEKDKEYAGEALCAKCHGDVATAQHTTSMYHAASMVSLSIKPIELDSLRFTEGGFNYSIGHDQSVLTYSVTHGAKSVSMPVAWVFGNGDLGRTYLLKSRNGFAEGRLSYYTKLNALDITTGHSEKIPGSVQEAFGHVLTSDTSERCFGCHTTASTVSGVFAPDKALSGITCEACHGPGARHVEDERNGGAIKAAAIVNPRSMSPEQSVDFCGACHRTSSDVTLSMPANLGTALVRFQPYRLEKSRCWGVKGDDRITCITCHDPHKPLVRGAKEYDAKCLACHRSTAEIALSARPQPASPQPGAQASVCKVGVDKCVTCHMPKVEVPQTHASFTDHYIRVVGSSAFPR